MELSASERLRWPTLTLHLVVLGVCLALSFVPPAQVWTSLLALALALGAAVCHALPAVRRRPLLGWSALGAVAVAAVAVTGGPTSALLPYLLAPAAGLGLLTGVRAVVVGSGTVAAALLVAGAVTRDRTDLSELAVVGGQWVTLGLCLGVVSVWARQTVSASLSAQSYESVRELLQQLRELTGRLPGGLDAPSMADAVLEQCAHEVLLSRSAVLVQLGGSGPLVPLAVRGSRRVPWRAALSEPGPLLDAWTTGRPVVDVRHADERRRGSALAALPLGDVELFGLVVLESAELDAFDGDRLDRLVRAAEAVEVRLETALLFEEVRSSVTLEERDRLAREMHDGVAQEVAFLGYQLDDLRSRAAKVDPGLAARVAVVRKDLTSLVSDIRMSITDLRTSVGPTRGLGQALASYVRAIGSGRDVVVHLALQESSFRLPGEQEVVLLRSAQAVAQHLRRSPDARNLWVELDVDPPSARLRVEHDGPYADEHELGLDVLSQTVSAWGGTLSVTRGKGGGPCLLVRTAGGEDDDPAHAG